MIVTVELEERSYDVVLDNGARHQLAALLAERAPRARVAVIVTTTTIANEPWFEFTTGIEQHVLTVPDGEAAKSLDVLEGLLEEVAQFAVSRSDVLIGVGGGALTDLVGFAAATYLRGIALVQIPTSLVGQVDAAIGGKTGVNLRSGKNLVGAFHQPIGVLCDFDTIATLPERERLAGLGEVAKCWLLEGGFAAELADVSLHDLIMMSVTFKAAVVGADELESGRRALLNYGHTLAHALEKVALARDSDELRHGEAVAIGLAFAVRVARALGRVDHDEVIRHDEVLDYLGLQRRIPEHFPTSSLLEAMAHDKKAHHDLTFVLAGAEGFETVSDVDPQLVSDELERFRGES